METALQVKDLKIGFKTDDRFVQAVDGLNLEIGQGETLGLVGESGCGKSVTSLSVLKLLPETAELSGKLLFKGKDLVQKSEKEMASIRGDQISMIFQDPMTSLNPVLTIEQQITEVIEQPQGGTKQQIQDRALQLMDMVKIPDGARRLKEYPHQQLNGQHKPFTEQGEDLHVEKVEK